MKYYVNNNLKITELVKTNLFSTKGFDAPLKFKSKFKQIQIFQCSVKKNNKMSSNIEDNLKIYLAIILQ